ncbi:Gfo/Idh/MocA family oxidoreductase [Pelagicoccus mobilis]|uniref:Gfo/Idh/MocA family oxidoreductase n=1 Tax=Pelagicoccus mobilis TaxID=415221 RepID=A0A934RYE8_9BACT|nr:Gfo/Idh/MocA family oxidoreductase [Pelagicoccus mobilis]MBK1875823.1 Gfo/Idh/MocA family oxidoreductase [Pelagicoccus mobilis]
MEISYKPELPQNGYPIVIIGAGGIVRDAHLPAYRQAGFKVHGITNRTRARAEALAKDFDIPNVYDSVEEAVAAAPSNAVFDITLMPNQFVAALEQLPDGAPVLIQKPMGDDLEQTKAILEVCRRKKLKAAINCQLRFAPFVMAARDIVSKGLIGELYDMEVRVSVETPWSLFPNVMHHPRLEIQQHSVHYIDLLRSFLGDPSGLWAKTCGNPHTDLSSTRTSLIFEYGEKLRASISTNHDHRFGSRNQESFIKWEGSKGAIIAKFGLLKNYPVGEEDSFEYCILEEGKEPVWQSVEIEGSWFPEAFIGSMAEVMRYAEGSSDHMATDVEDVAKTMACVEAAYSSSDGGSTPIPVL